MVDIQKHGSMSHWMSKRPGRGGYEAMRSDFVPCVPAGVDAFLSPGRELEQKPIGIVRISQNLIESERI